MEGVDRAKKPPGPSVLFNRDELRAVLARLDGVRWAVASLVYGSGLWLMEYAGCASGTSIRDNSCSSNSGLAYKLPSCWKIAGEQYATLAPPILGDCGVLLGRQHPSPSPGVTAFHRCTASGGHSSSAADIASAGDTGAWDRKDPPAVAIVPPYAPWGSVATLARRPPLLPSLWRVPPTWADCQAEERRTFCGGPLQPLISALSP